MYRDKKRRAAPWVLALTILMCISTVVLYAKSRETLNRAAVTYEEAENLFLAAELLHNQAELAQEAAESARKAAEAMEPEQVIVYVEREVVPEDLSEPNMPAAEPEEAPVPASEPETVSLGNYRVTAYCPCEICCGHWASNRPVDEVGNPIVYTSSGARAKAGTTIAVDPEVIPHGTSVWFEGPDGMREYIAQDTGGAVDGNHIDLYFDSHEEALAWGSRTREVFREVASS